MLKEITIISKELLLFKALKKITCFVTYIFYNSHWNKLHWIKNNDLSNNINYLSLLYD